MNRRWYNQENRMEKKEQFRVVIDRGSNEELEKVVKELKEEFEMVNITKSDVANYVFKNLERFISERERRELGHLHFDGIKALSVMMRKYKEGGEVPLEMKKMLREMSGPFPKERKR